MKNPITLSDIFTLSFDAEKRLWPYITHQVLSFILEAPEFYLSTYNNQKSDVLQPPQPIHKLPHGKENATLQFLLGSVNIPEASYVDNLCLIIEFLRQVKWETLAQHMLMALKKLIAWCGDQLTIDRLQGLFRYQA